MDREQMKEKMKKAGQEYKGQFITQKKYNLSKLQIENE